MKHLNRAHRLAMAAGFMALSALSFATGPVYSVDWTPVATELSAHVTALQTGITPYIIAFTIMVAMLFFGLKLIKRPAR